MARTLWAFFGCPWDSTSAGGVSGTFAATFPAPTMAASGTAVRQGTFAGTFPTPTMAASGTAVHQGTFSGTFPTPTMEATGKAAHPGTFAGTFPVPTMAASGTVTSGAGEVSGTFAGTFPTPTMAATGTAVLQGTFAGTFPVPTMAASGTAVHQGTFSGTFPTPTMEATGKAAHPGTFAATFPAPTMAATGQAAHSGTFAGTFPVPTMSATGVVGVGVTITPSGGFDGSVTVELYEIMAGEPIWRQEDSDGDVALRLWGTNYSDRNLVLGGAGGYLLGQDNAVFGCGAGPYLAKGDDNGLFGAVVCPDLLDGDGNTVVGAGSGAGIVRGSYNTILGANVTGLSPTLASNIILADGQGNIRGQYASGWTLATDLTVPHAHLTATTGTAPLVVASTTLVTNLNADLLDGNEASAFATSGHTHSYVSSVSGTSPIASSGGTTPAISLAVSAADKYLYSTALNTWTEGSITAAGRALLDDAAASNQCTTLGLGTGDSPQFTKVGAGCAPAYGIDSETAVGTTFLKCGSSYAVYLMGNSAGVGFNAYESTGWKFGKGSTSKYGGYLQWDHTNNLFALSGSTATGNADATLTALPFAKIGAGAYTFPKGAYQTSSDTGTGFLLRLNSNESNNKQLLFGDPDYLGNSNYTFLRALTVNGISYLDCVNGVVSALKPLRFMGVNGVYISTNTNTLGVAHDMNSAYDLWVNYNGYQDGTTQYRNFKVGDGKHGTIASFAYNDITFNTNLYTYSAEGGTLRNELRAAGNVFHYGITQSDVSANPVVYWGTGELIVDTSSRRFKENERPLEIDTSDILKLQMVSYRVKKTGEEKHGYIAEDCASVAPWLAVYEHKFDGERTKEDLKSGIDQRSVIKTNIVTHYNQKMMLPASIEEIKRLSRFNVWLLNRLNVKLEDVPEEFKAFNKALEAKQC